MVIAAAGNNNNNTLFYPASFAKVLSVSATTNNDARASFSSFGPAVDVSAPGVSIASTYRDNEYWAMSGTSMATPHVAGLAALIRSLHPEFTLAEVETAIKATALDLGDPGWDKYFGHGRIQPPLALVWAPPDITAPVATLAVPLAGRDNVSESVHPVVAFDEPVTGVDATSVRIRTSTGIWLDAAVTYDGVTNRATIEPAAQLQSNTTYRVVVGGAIADLAGNFIAQDSWGFTTGDTINPSVLESHPNDGATDVGRGVTITITLDEKVTGVSGGDHPAPELQDRRPGRREGHLRQGNRDDLHRPGSPARRRALVPRQDPARDRGRGREQPRGEDFTFKTRA